MCGRFSLDTSNTEIKKHFEVTNQIPLFEKSYNVAPSSTIPVVTKNSPTKCFMAHWGFIPSWADPKKAKFRPINARDDKLTGGYYRQAINETRCIIPATGFYEWKRQTVDGEEIKIPYFIHLKKHHLFGFAGIYSEHKDAEGKQVFTCAIITTKPNELMKPIHDRMPVIIGKQDEEEWLTGNNREVLHLVRPYDSDLMEAWKVSRDVNSPRNDSEDLIKPIN